MNNLTSAFGAMKICQVDQNPGHISRNCPSRVLQPQFGNLRNEPRRNKSANPEVGDKSWERRCMKDEHEMPPWAQKNASLKIGNVPVEIAKVNSEKPVTSKGHIVDDQLSEFVRYIPNVEVVMEGVRVFQEFYIMKAVSSNYKKSSFVASIDPKGWIDISKCNNNDDSKEDHEDIMTM
ncbi:21657_t:CDS:2 [Racocetra persica]|uniref:21657_t:CDS:1 n=1 Tax=Racocetra persica TaxID=160502 RepID=A0ACA9KF22_9GLOM|nr:21657_t:CDS:2 [Racocetra persica]